MEAEGAAAINKTFWEIMGKLWSDFPHERHTASDFFRKYTAEHKIHVCDVSQTVDTTSTPDWQLRSEAVRLRRTVETLEAEVKELKRARDKEAEAHQTARCAFEVLRGILEEQLQRAREETTEAKTALAKEQARLKAKHDQSEALALDLKRQLQTVEAHAQALRTELAGANALLEELEHALGVACASATSYQRELLVLKQQHRQQQTPINRLGAAA